MSMSISISRVDPSCSGRSSGSVGLGGSAGMEERDEGSGKGGESVSGPIPIVGGKMKRKGIEYKC
jgi:hypothetical protein